MLQDSGNRREFETGAVRDIDSEKGRCDLLPLSQIAILNNDDGVLKDIDAFIRDGQPFALVSAVKEFCKKKNWDLYTAMLEVSKHYKDGCEKYGERNWEKGIPLHCYMDSAIRHYLKWCRGDTDERHDRAFIWNIVSAMWTLQNLPELNDLPFGGDKGEQE